MDRRRAAARRPRLQSRDRLPGLAGAVRSAEKLLAIARDGLPVLFVNNTAEIRAHGRPAGSEYGNAASKAGSSHDSDEQLAGVVGQIKALSNVRTIDRQADAMAALRVWTSSRGSAYAPAATR